MSKGLKCHLWSVSVYFTGQTIMQKKDQMELNFECLKMLK